MNRDPIVEEIHKTRKKIMEECGGDLDRLLDHVKAGEEQDRRRVVSTTSLSTKSYVMKSTESVVRSLLGAVPSIGTALNEAVFDLRARLKQERLERFVQDLADALQTLESEMIDVGYIQSEEFVDFLEDVLIRATKVRAAEKRKKLAAVLAGRMQQAEGTAFDDRFLDLLIALSETQVCILAEHLRAAEDQKSAEETNEHRQPGYYNVSEREYCFLVQDLMSKALVHAPVFGRGHLGPIQHLEATELGQAFIRFLENGRAL